MPCISQVLVRASQAQWLLNLIRCNSVVKLRRFFHAGNPLPVLCRRPGTVLTGCVPVKQVSMQFDTACKHCAGFYAGVA